MTRFMRALSVCALGLALSSSQALASTYPLASVLPEDPAKKLSKAGVKTTDDLLQQGATPRGRAKLAKATGIASKDLMEWVRVADLLRIKGVGPVMVRLLKEVGVVSVAQLKQRNAKSLYEAVMKANDKAKITQNPPSEKHLENWIEQAKKLSIVLK